MSVEEILRDFASTLLERMASYDEEEVDMTIREYLPLLKSAAEGKEEKGQ